MKTIESILKEMENGNCAIYGVRTDSKKYVAGDQCDISLDTCDNEVLGELDGTSATGFGFLYFDGEQEDIDEVKKALDFNWDFYKEKYDAKYQYIIGGDEYDYGQDEHEIIIKNAKVICVIEK